MFPLLAALTLKASPAQMGLLSEAATTPFLLIGLLVGVWVDRVRRSPLLVSSDLARAALLVAVPVAWATGWLSMGLLYAAALGVGALTVVFEVASMSLLPALVGRGRLVEGNGKLEASRSLAQIGGPGIAGNLVALLGGLLGGEIGVRATLVFGMAGMLLASLWLILSPVRSWAPRREKGRTP